MPIQWIYANGSTWVSLDAATQQQIEVLWSRHGSSWIHSNSFDGPVYVDTTEMLLMAGGYSFVIARRKN
ncbi:hypothetical protein G6F55_010439 [Rhizopus delemar]|uniref:WWE domain-containing protein n=2 Tax=Rhizopus TaxID=4842 RepID=A0A9P6YV57_9FUNG|nr:hypothetical protein G6F43_009366 [Rhizopus delemar]KAG1154776.1 hypothetical protein G6F36_014450 [Rhizopus arrhizus]KAG1448856.1 hypothetical protein G6F55_010439 [Rhizopus delemar]KAG1513012.1 hypothetical protein G6F52_010269 [Rhizopus delemar]KAG1536145.1 hypothetical protein G6F51_011129 [Rhizopus arrhizus]